ncbi:MAG: FkbM family methyltransferase [Acidobacteria bacterium]|nr:FkbM family methyltransferase [Acidobacteriota bacterium]
MAVWLERFNRCVPWPVRAALVLSAGVGTFLLLATPANNVALKLSGRMRECPWSRVLRLEPDVKWLAAALEVAQAEVSVTGHDPALDIDLVRTRERPFWVKRGGEQFGGRELIAYLLAEHRWMIRSNESDHVRPGDVVVDCGAHVGVFTHYALARGAARVIAVEPEPVNVECFHRNFAAEIARGTVVLAPQGVWSSETTLELTVAAANSGMNSVVAAESGTMIRIPVTTIDRIADQLRLARVDFLKMDIEGAEREALAGAAGTLRRFRPRLMLDSYHRPDDPVVLPALLRGIHSGYRETCGPCEPDGAGRQYVPHVTYYR